MANKIMSQGLIPNGQVRQANSYLAGATIYPGDLVRMDANGVIIRAAADTTANIGVALSYATSGQKVLVADDAEQEYSVTASGTVAAQTAMGLNYQIELGTASTLYKRSAMKLDAATGASDSNLPLRALRVDQTIDNALGPDAKVIVKMNNAQRGNKVEGV